MDMDKLIPQLTDYGVRIVGVLLVFYIGLKLARWLSGFVERRVAAKLDVTLGKFFGNLTRYGLITLLVIASLGAFGIETTSFAAVIGAAGLAIGLALQGTLQNFSSGVMLLIFRPFKVGDVISVGGQVGGVQELGLFVTVLDTPDNRRIIIPNGQVFGTTIENLTHHDLRRCDVNVGTDYTADLGKTREVLEAAARAVPGQAQTPPQVFLAGLGGSSIDWQVRVWAKTSDYWDVLQATTKIVKDELDKAGIGIPFPQMDVHLDK